MEDWRGPSVASDANVTPGTVAAGEGTGGEGRAVAAVEAQAG